ncbi:MAG: hypothetical protein EOO77_35885 [Oxalobacteraceae bacterium]|nr:MAG: hypothetical protein EOO77_35885 [Oxalobacteraceae bacterium]
MRNGIGMVDLGGSTTPNQITIASDKPYELDAASLGITSGFYDLKPPTQISLPLITPFYKIA